MLALFVLRMGLNWSQPKPGVSFSRSVRDLVNALLVNLQLIRSELQMWLVNENRRTSRVLCYMDGAHLLSHLLVAYTCSTALTNDQLRGVTPGARTRAHMAQLFPWKPREERDKTASELVRNARNQQGPQLALRYISTTVWLILYEFQQAPWRALREDIIKEGTNVTSVRVARAMRNARE